MHEIFGGFNSGAMARLARLTHRAKRRDSTVYVAHNATQFATHWSQRISAAIVFGDARRALEHVNTLKLQLTPDAAPVCASPPRAATFESAAARDHRKRARSRARRGAPT